MGVGRSSPREAPCWEPRWTGPQDEGPSCLGACIVGGGGTRGQSESDVDPEPRSPGPPVFLSARPEEAHRGLRIWRECPRDDILEAELRSEPPATGSRLAGNGGPRALLLLTALADRACHLAPWFRSLIVSKKQSVKMPPDLANVIEGQRGAPAAHRRRRPPHAHSRLPPASAAGPASH